MSKELTLALSEVAGRVNVGVSSADSPAIICDKLVARYEELNPISLSENEMTMTRQLRESKIDTLVERGLTPAIGNRLKLSYCSDALQLSQEPESFDLVLSLVADVLESKILSLTEQSAAQRVKQDDKSFDAQWAEQTKARQPV